MFISSTHRSETYGDGQDTEKRETGHLKKNSGMDKEVFEMFLDHLGESNKLNFTRESEKLINLRVQADSMLR